MAGAREATARTQPPSGGAIDVHAHFYPERFIKALADAGGAPGVGISRSPAGAPVLSVGGVPADVTYWDLPKRLQRMDAQGVKTHVLSLTTPMVHWGPAERGAELARIYNDAVVEAHAAFPDRFVGCATLPIQDPPLSVKELDRLAGNHAICGVCLPTSNVGRPLSEAALFPIYERCEALNLPVFLHPINANVVGVAQLGSYYLTNLLGNPFDTAMAASYLVFGGVLDRYSRLTIVLPHAGGALPSLVGRLAYGQKARPENRKGAQRPFAEYLRRFYYDTIAHSPAVLKFLVELVGADRVMLGSDYCFDMGTDRPREIVTQLGLQPAEQDKILFANAASLLRLPGGAAGRS